MKSPLERLKKEWRLHSDMHDSFERLRKKVDREMESLKKGFTKEIKRLEKKAGKIKVKEEIALWKKGGYEKISTEIKKKADALVQEIRRDYRKAAAKIKR